MRETTMYLSDASIDQAIKKLELMKSRVGQAMLDALNKIVDVGAEVMRKTFGSAAVISTDIENITDNSITFVVQADGDAICFIEFGTGFWTDSSHEYADIVSIDVYPGSWSKDHAHNFENYEGDPDKYPYNRQPHCGMLRAFNDMKNAAPRIMKEVFEKL